MFHILLWIKKFVCLEAVQTVYISISFVSDLHP